MLLIVDAGQAVDFVFLFEEEAGLGDNPLCSVVPDLIQKGTVSPLADTFGKLELFQPDRFKAFDIESDFVAKNIISLRDFKTRSSFKCP